MREAIKEIIAWWCDVCLTTTDVVVRFSREVWDELFM